MKKSWADMADEDDLSIDVIVTRHGIKVKKTPPDKTKETIDNRCVKYAVKSSINQTTPK